MSNRTPGPWKVNKYGSIGAGEFGTDPIVATVEQFWGEDRRHGDHVANAELIANAPEMVDKIANLTAERDALTAQRDELIQRWRPIDTCPKHVEVLFWREDAGVMLGEFTSLDSFMTDNEREESRLTDDELERDDYWAFGPDGLTRLEDGFIDERPTHWMPLPAGPDAASDDDDLAELYDPDTGETEVVSAATILEEREEDAP